MQKATLVLLVRGGRVCLGFKKTGFGRDKYTGFGGKVEPGETILHAAARELYEEAGIQVDERELAPVGCLVFRFPSRPEWGQEVYTFRLDAWTGEPVEGREMRPEWFSFERIPYEQMWADSRYWLPPILDGRPFSAEFVFAADNETLTEISNAKPTLPIRILTAGGSLDKVYSTRTSAFEVGPPQAGRVLREANLALDVQIEPLIQKDSLELTTADRERIAARVRAAPEQHILITHGTDTLVQTALCLEGIPGKVIVLTGAMQPAAFRESDAPFNLGFALAAVQALPPGVYLAMNGRIFDPRRARKNGDRERFEEV